MKQQPEKGEWFIFSAKNGTPYIGVVTATHKKTDKRYVSYFVFSGRYKGRNPLHSSLHKSQEVDALPKDVALNLIALYKE